MSIRIKNTRTGKTIDARDGKDAALIAKVELDRRSGIEVQKLPPLPPSENRGRCVGTAPPYRAAIDGPLDATDSYGRPTCGAGR